MEFKRVLGFLIAGLVLLSLVWAADFVPAQDPDRASGNDFSSAGNGSGNESGNVSGLHVVGVRLVLAGSLAPLLTYNVGESKSVEVQLNLSGGDLDHLDLDASALNPSVNPDLFKVTLFRSSCSLEGAVLVCTTQSAFQLKTSQASLSFPITLVERLEDDSLRSSSSTVQVELPIPVVNQSNVSSNLTPPTPRVASNLRLVRNGQPVVFVSSKHPRVVDVLFDVDGPVQKAVVRASRLIPFTLDLDASCSSGANGTVCSLKDKLVQTNESTGPVVINLTSSEGVVSGQELAYSVTIDDTSPELLAITTPLCQGSICYLKPGKPTNITVALQDSVGTLDQRLVAFQIGSSAAQLVENCSGFTCTGTFKGSCSGKVQAKIASFQGVPSQDDAGNLVKGNTSAMVCDGSAPSVEEPVLKIGGEEDLGTVDASLEANASVGRDFVLLNDLVTITAVVRDDSPVTLSADLSFLGTALSSSATATVSSPAIVQPVVSNAPSDFVQASSEFAVSSSSLEAGNNSVQVPCQQNGTVQVCTLSFTNTNPGPLRASLPLTFTDMVGNAVQRSVELVILKTEETRAPDNFKVDKQDFSPKRVNIQTLLLFNKRVLTTVTLKKNNVQAQILSLDVRGCSMAAENTPSSLAVEKLSVSNDSMTIVSQVLLPHTVQPESNNLTLTCQLGMTSRDNVAFYKAEELENYTFSLGLYNSATMDFKVQEEIDRVANGSLDDLRRYLEVFGTINNYAQIGCKVINLLQTINGVCAGADGVLGSFGVTQPAGQAINNACEKPIGKVTKHLTGNSPIGQVCQFLQCSHKYNRVVTGYMEKLPGLDENGIVTKFASTMGGVGSVQFVSSPKEEKPKDKGTGGTPAQGKVIYDPGRMTGYHHAAGHANGPSSPSGPTGPSGASGPSGPTGGVTGPSNPQGPSGPSSPTGPNVQLPATIQRSGNTVFFNGNYVNRLFTMPLDRIMANTRRTQIMINSLRREGTLSAEEVTSLNSQLDQIAVQTMRITSQRANAPSETPAEGGSLAEAAVAPPPAAAGEPASNTISIEEAVREGRMHQTTPEEFRQSGLTTEDLRRMGASEEEIARLTGNGGATTSVAPPPAAATPAADTPKDNTPLCDDPSLEVGALCNDWKTGISRTATADDLHCKDPNGCKSTGADATSKVDAPDEDPKTKNDHPPQWLAYYRPENSLVVSAMSLCLPGITYNLEKMTTIDCEYIRCLKLDVPAGLPPQECQRDRSYQKCKFVTGEVFNAIPYTAIYQNVMQEMRRVVTNPYSLSMLVLGMFVCHPLQSPASGYCQLPKAIEFIQKVMGLIGNIRSVATQFQQLRSVDFSPESYCDSVMKLKVPPYLQLPPDIQRGDFSGFNVYAGSCKNGECVNAQGQKYHFIPEPPKDSSATGTAASSSPAAAATGSQSTGGSGNKHEEASVPPSPSPVGAAVIRFDPSLLPDFLQPEDGRNAITGNAEKTAAAGKAAGVTARLSTAAGITKTLQENVANAQRMLNSDPNNQAVKQRAAEAKAALDKFTKKNGLTVDTPSNKDSRIRSSDAGNDLKAVKTPNDADKTTVTGVSNADAKEARKARKEAEKAEAEKAKKEHEAATKKVLEDGAEELQYSHFGFGSFRAAMSLARNAYYASSLMMPNFDWWGYTSYVDKFFNNAVFNLQGYAESKICLDRKGTWKRGSMGSQAVLVKDPSLNVEIPGAHVEGDGNEEARLKESDLVIYDYVVTAGVKIFKGSGLQFDIAAYSEGEEKVLQSVQLNESPSSFVAEGATALTFNSTKVFDTVCLKFKSNPKDFFDQVRLDSQDRLCNFVSVQGVPKPGQFYK